MPSFILISTLSPDLRSNDEEISFSSFNMIAYPLSSVFKGERVFNFDNVK